MQPEWVQQAEGHWQCLSVAQVQMAESCKQTELLMQLAESCEQALRMLVQLAESCELANPREGRWWQCCRTRLPPVKLPWPLTL